MPSNSVTEARQTLPAQLDLVERGEEVAISRHGKVIAVIVRPDVLAARRAVDTWRAADAIADRPAEARTRPLSPGSISAERVEELVASIRADRDGR